MARRLPNRLLLVHHFVELVGVDPVPIYGRAQARAGGEGDVAVGVDGFELVRVVAGVDRGFGGLDVGVDQAKLVVVRVANGGHAVAVGGPGRVDRDVQAEAFGRVRNLHQASDAAIVVGVG